MSNLNHIVYQKCLNNNHQQLSQVVQTKFKASCLIIISNNVKASFEQLCESCAAVLNILLENPAADLPVGKFLLK
jgi:hypothetical protein